jgi:hypothetical protein
MTISGIFGFLLPGLVFIDFDHEDFYNGKKRFRTIILIEAILASIALLPNLFLFKEKPPTRKNNKILK